MRTSEDYDFHVISQGVMLSSRFAIYNKLGIEAMRYFDGSEVGLGDIVRVPVPNGESKARVVMLGDTYAHSDIDEQFLSWVKERRTLRASSIVIEWLGENPFAHQDPKHAPVGNYMFTDVDEFVVRDA